MYLIWVDESGSSKTQAGSAADGKYVICGVITPEDDWKRIEDGISGIKKGIFPTLDPRMWELHAADLWNDRGFFAQKEHMQSFREKQEIFSRVFEFMSESSASLICIIANKDKLAERYLHPQPLRYAWTFIVERFEHFLNQRPTKPGNGLFFIDASRRNVECEIKDVVFRMATNGSGYLVADHVVECPIFVKSDRHNMIQAADMVAYAVHRHYKGDPRFREV